MVNEELWCGVSALRPTAEIIPEDRQVLNPELACPCMALSPLLVPHRFFFLLLDSILKLILFPFIFLPLLLFWLGVSLCSSRWPRTHYTVQAGLTLLVIPPASAPYMLGSELRALTLVHFLFFTCLAQFCVGVYCEYIWVPCCYLLNQN